MAALQINSVYKHIKNYHPQVYVEECKCRNQQCIMLSDHDDDDGFFEV